MKLGLHEPAVRLAELRRLWCDWDPIGVIVDGWPDDEYDYYLEPTLKFLIERAPVEELATYLETVTSKTMGLGSNDYSRKSSRAFAEKLIQWFEARWAGRAQ